VGSNVGDAVGTKDGDNEGCGVVLPGKYVGSKVGNAVGTAVGPALGTGVFLPGK